MEYYRWVVFMKTYFITKEKGTYLFYILPKLPKTNLRKERGDTEIAYELLLHQNPKK